MAAGNPTILPLRIQEDPSGAIEELKNLGYAKIASKIELLWGSKELAEYFRSLVINTRGDREGFPDEVFSLILKIYICHEFGKFLK